MKTGEARSQHPKSNRAWMRDGSGGVVAGREWLRPNAKDTEEGMG